MSQFYQVDYIENSFDRHPRLVPDAEFVELLMQRPATLLDVENIRRGKEEAKRYLPAVVWGGHFAGGERRDGDCLSSGLFCQDIDHIADSPDDARLYYQQHFAGREEELGIVFAHVSPSATGLHVVCLLPEHCHSIAEAQAWLAAETRSQYDPVCKNIGRIFYLSTYRDIIYNDLL